VDHPGAVGLRQALDLDDVVPAAGRALELEAALDDAARRLELLDLVELLGPALHLAALAAWARKRSMKRISLASMACWRSYSASRRRSRAPAPLVEVVVAGVAADRAAVDLDDLLDHAVHHVAVVAGHDHRARVVTQEASSQRIDSMSR
jgi:hypothetical protein